jgi:hypothetical protein
VKILLPKTWAAQPDTQPIQDESFETAEIRKVFALTLYEFMYLRAIFCTFQISVDFYFVTVGGRGGGRGGLEKGRGLEIGG